MNTDEYSRMAELEDSYWWHVGRISILSHQLGKLSTGRSRILNVGCGTGGTIPLLSQYGDVTNVDVSPEAVKFCQQKGYEAKLVAIDTLPFPDKSFDMLVATDVLEHIESDLAALQEWRRVLTEDGFLVLTVPAYQWLWSAHDEALHHYRRYSLGQLHRLINLAGYQVKKRSYIITFSFFIIVGYRFLASIFSGRKPSAKPSPQSSYVILPKPINRLFILLLQIEAIILRFINFPFGTSIIIISKKITKLNSSKRAK
jgi:SAM-dependent methyltransferase